MVLAAVVLATAALYFARDVLIPLALSVMLSFLLAPLVTRIERTGMRRVPSVIIVTVFSFTIVGAFGWLVAAQAADLVQQLPKYRRNIAEKVRSVRETLTSVGQASKAVQEITEQIAAESTSQTAAKNNEANGEEVTRASGDSGAAPVKVEVVATKWEVIPFLRRMVGPLVRPLVTAAIVVVFVVFILVQREDLRDRIIRLVGSRQITVTTEAFDEAASRVSRYLVAHIVLNGSYGAAVAFGLGLIGVPNALLWGLLAALLRFIPYIGPWVAALLPVTLSLAVFDHWTRPILVIGWFIAIELVSNNVVEPWLYGSQIGASPLAIIVSAVFWTWLWGGVGLVLATPLTVCLVVVGKYVPPLEFLAILLGNEPVLEPDMRFYQRLVAMDRREAREILDDALDSASLTDTYDTVVIPALRQAQRDRHRGILDHQIDTFIHESVRGLIDECGSLKPGTRAFESPPSFRVLCVPAHDEADELTAVMLSQVLQRVGVNATSLSVEALAAERVSMAFDAEPHLVCVCALPPATLNHARYLCKRFRKSPLHADLILGLWSTAEEYKRAAERIAHDFHVTVVATLRDAQRVIRSRARVLPD